MVVTDGGTIIRLPVDQVNTYSRYAKGVRIIKPGTGELVVSIHPVAAMDDDDVLDEGLEDGLEGAELATEDGAVSDDEAPEAREDETPDTPDEEA